MASATPASRSLPEPLARLTTLAFDLHWAWNHAGDAVWRQLDEALWERTQNPWQLLQYVPFEKFREQTTPRFAQASYEHIARSHSVSIDKARTLLGYRPQYSSLAAVAEALEWLRTAGEVDVPEFEGP